MKYSDTPMGKAFKKATEEVEDEGFAPNRKGQKDAGPNKDRGFAPSRKGTKVTKKRKIGSNY